MTAYILRRVELDQSGEFAFWEALIHSAERARAEGNFEEAQLLVQRALEHARVAFSDDIPLARTWLLYAQVLEDAEDLVEAEAAYREALQLFKSQASRRLYALVLHNLAEVVERQGRTAESRELRTLAQEILRSDKST